MKIVIEITEDSYPERKFDMIIEDTEHQAFKQITIDDEKYSVSTSDLRLLAKMY